LGLVDEVSYAHKILSVIVLKAAKSSDVLVLFFLISATY